MASVMARWSACILHNVCRNSQKPLMTMTGIERTGNTTIFIFAQTSDNKPVSRVSLLFLRLSGSFILYFAQNIINHITKNMKY